MVKKLFICFALMMAMLSVQAVVAQEAEGESLQDRVIASIEFEGLKNVPRQLVLNQMRLKAGMGYDPRVVARDIENITRLGRFESVEARVRQDVDGRVVLIIVLDEQIVLAEVSVVGNKAISDQELMDAGRLRSGDMRDDFLIGRARQSMLQTYKQAGYNFVKINIDEEILSKQNILIFHIVEGPRIKLWELDVEGNVDFSRRQILSEVRSETFFPIISKGVMTDETINFDVQNIRKFYFDRGYLNARVGRKIVLDARQVKARVVFKIQEGPKFLIERIQFKGSNLYSDTDLTEAMILKIGDVMTREKVERSRKAIEDKYHKLGYIGTRVSIDPVFQLEGTKVFVTVNIIESRRSVVGNVIVRGNKLTKDKIIRRLLRGIEPGRPYDQRGIARSERLLSGSALFQEARITVMGNEGDPIRDALVDVEEARTGEVSLGAGVTDSAGVVGNLSISQRNFDVTDYPESIDELVAGQAFLGGGQTFNLTLSPGVEVQNYSVSLFEPYLFDSSFSGSVSLAFRMRDFDAYDEQRYGFTLASGRRFGDVYSGSVSLKLENINVTGLDSDPAVDYLEIEGRSLLDIFSINMERTTVDSRLFPTRGSRLNVGLDYAGLIGDHDFARFNVGYKQFWTLDEDFTGRKSVLSLSVDAGYVFNGEAPVFERYFAGSRTFRGFDFRGIGPVGRTASGATQEDEKVGGQYQLLVSLEYNFPIFRDIIRWVVFTDQGTITDEIGIEDWRVSVGTGIRMVIPIFGEVPFAVDFAAPLIKKDTDEVQVVSFSLDLPFQ